MDNRIIIIDDERDFLDSVKRGLIISGFKSVHLENDPRRATFIIEQGEAFDIALIDVTMPHMNGVEVLEAIKNISPNMECIMVTAVNEARIAVECLKKGAYDYLVKPISREDLLLTITHALERKRLLDILDMVKREAPPKLSHSEAFKPIITGSSRVLRILKEAELHAVSNVPVLITGESGTGKELLANAIHAASPRSKYPFIPINMASLTGNLFDAEFFGHTKGAFTGAEKDRLGYLEHTDHGTLFLDEISNLPLELQGKLLRVLQEGEFIKLGTNSPQKVDVRFIAASNTDLDRLMVKGKFRKDLYYRLKGAWVHLPPLRERQGDIPLLINRFLDEFSAVIGSWDIEEEARLLLMNYDYPGNIRELKSIIRSAMNLAQDKSISINLLPHHLRRLKPRPILKPWQGAGPNLLLAEAEKTHVLGVYKELNRNKTQTAKLLGIGLNTLRRKLESYGVR